MVVIDSIQTMMSDDLTSAPGSVSQVRDCAAQLTRLAKQQGVAVVMIGHVTKEGALAARAFWNTWWTRCSISRATAIPPTG